MALRFNIAGPCDPNMHYMLPALDRISGVDYLIEGGEYFVIHAARQSGKTTFLEALVNKINDEKKYYALYCTLEAMQGISNTEKAMDSFVAILEKAIHSSELPLEKIRIDVAGLNEVVKVGTSLTQLCKSLDKPLVVLFDEADCLTDDSLILFLRQIRAGYINRRRAPFPHSLALIGMRNIRDYKAKVRPESESLDSASPFNITAKALTLKNFTVEEIAELYGQHTRDTKQIFLPEAIERAWYWSRGQPWIVNALARQIVVDDLALDYTQTITSAHFDAAAETLMLRRGTHIDSLLARLSDSRVKKIIGPMLTGETLLVNMVDDDLQFCLDLGLIAHEKDEGIRPSNPIYADVMVRMLNYMTQEFDIPKEVGNKWIENGRIDVTGLLKEFQRFWQKNSAIWLERYDYKEAAPHLILQAFLQRVKNGRAELSREYALDTHRVDLLLEHSGKSYPIELKLAKRYYPDVEKTHAQLFGYMDTCAAEEGWLVIFDNDPNKDWDEKIFWEEHPTPNGKRFHIVGC